MYNMLCLLTKSIIENTAKVETERERVREKDDLNLD